MKASRTCAREASSISVTAKPAATTLSAAAVAKAVVMVKMTDNRMEALPCGLLIGGSRPAPGDINHSRNATAKNGTGSRPASRFDRNSVSSRA